MDTRMSLVEVFCHNVSVAEAPVELSPVADVIHVSLYHGITGMFPHVEKVSLMILYLEIVMMVTKACVPPIPRHVAAPPVGSMSPRLLLFCIVLIRRLKKATSRGADVIYRQRRARCRCVAA